jgi:hypothetical protein
MHADLIPARTYWVEYCICTMLRYMQIFVAGVIASEFLIPYPNVILSMSKASQCSLGEDGVHVS